MAPAIFLPQTKYPSRQTKLLSVSLGLFARRGLARQNELVSFTGLIFFLCLHVRQLGFQPVCRQYVNLLGRLKSAQSTGLDSLYGKLQPA